MVEPYDLQEIDSFATIEQFSEPLIDKYSQNFSIQNNFGINISNKTHYYPIFIFFNGHIKFLDTISYLINDSESIKEINESGFKELSTDNTLINMIPGLKKYISFYKESYIFPNKIIISKSISYSFENFFSELINENGFINSSIDIYSLINDLNMIENTTILNKVRTNKSFSCEITNIIQNCVIYNKEFKYSFIYNNNENKKIDIGNWNEFEIIYSSESPTILNKVYDNYHMKFWNNFLISYHTAILEEIEATERDTISFKHNLDTIIRNMFITSKETNLENNSKSYTIEEIYLRIRDRLDNDYGFSTYFIIKLIEDYLIDYKTDGKYQGLIDRYDYQINNNLETHYKERSKLYD